MIEVRFHGTGAEVEAEMARFASFLSGGAPKVETPKAPKKEKVADSAEANQATQTKSAVPTLDDVKATITKMLGVEKIGKPGVIKFFGDHYAPAKKASELAQDPAVFAAFIAKAEELMK